MIGDKIYISMIKTIVWHEKDVIYDWQWSMDDDCENWDDKERQLVHSCNNIGTALVSFYIVMEIYVYTNNNYVL